MEIKLISFFRWLLIAFYVVAGINHFLNPKFYLDLIPPYIPFPEFINICSGVLEVLLALGVIFTKTRSLAVIGILVMLLAFIPSHIFFIQIGSCVENSLCVEPWLAWVRLLVIHPLLIVWVWKIKGK